MAQELSLDLGLAPYDPWGFRKRLSETDLRNGGALYLPKEDFENAIISEMDHDRVHNMGSGIQVKVLVIGEGLEYIVSLIRCNGPKYMFRGGWYDIVRDMGLRKNDEIGLLWNNSSERFYLHHLK